MRHAFFILHNPNAGRAARETYHAVLRLMRERGANVETVETGGHGEGMRATGAAAASGLFDAVVAAGGDGTVHDAAAGLIGSSLPFGIIPVGTANVLARELGVPVSPERIVDMLLSGAVRPMPIGRINGRPFLIVVGVGFDAEAVRHFEDGRARRFGQFGLVGPVLQALVSNRGSGLRVTTDNGVSMAEWIIVTRARRYAGGLLLTPEAGVNDNLVHVVRFGGHGPLVRLRQLCMLGCGLIRFDPDVTIEASGRVRVEGDGATPVQVDGEMLEALPLDISVGAERLSMILPRA